MLRIYGRANSINVRKVLWAVDEIGLPYEREDWGRGTRPTSEPEYKALNPFGVVPTIDDDGFILRESNAIVRYLAAKHEQAGLLPDDPQKRATGDAWMDWASAEVYDDIRPIVHFQVFKNQAYADPAIQQAAIEGLNNKMQLFDTELSKTGPYLLGDQFSVADIPVGLVVNRWASLDIERPDLAHVARYYDTLAEREPYRKHGRNGLP